MSSALSRTPRVVIALMLREMTTAYGKSPGGYFWVIAQPLAGIAFLTIIFSMFVRTPPIGISFPLFYGTGVLMLSMFRDLSGKMTKAIQFSKALLTYPSVTFMDAILARFLLNALTQILVFCLVMTGILTVFDNRAVLDIPTMALSVALTFVLAFGLGTFNCMMFGFFPIYENLWSIAMRPLILVSGVFYLFEALSPDLQAILWYNPIIHIIGIMRDGVYGTYEPAYVSVGYVVWFSVIPAVIGLFFLKRYHRVILYEL